MRSLPLLAAAASFASATLTISDPSDYQDLAADAADNAIKADYQNATIMYQYISVVGPYYFNGTDAELDHRVLSVDKDDTSVVVVTEDATLKMSYVTVIKEGYSSDLLQASFFGVNAAVNVANASKAFIDHANITTHNGAANVYSFGNDSVAYVNNTSLYSSGPVAHGLYAGGNGTIYGHNVKHYSGGNRCSSFSGDSPVGYVHVYDSLAHTAGIGSAIFYALGYIYGTNTVGLAENSPALFMDGGQTAEFENVDLTAGLLAGTVMFSSMERQSGAYISLSNSKLTTLGTDMASLWFGNTIATADLYATELNATSGILVIANSSQVTQEFNYFAGGEQNSAILPAEVEINVAESTLTGDIVAYNGSSISWNLTDYTTWTGYAYSAYEQSYFAVSLDKSSTWVLTNDTTVQNFTDADASLKNVKSNGFNIYYDSSSEANSWLQGSSHALHGGGSLKAA